MPSSKSSSAGGAVAAGLSEESGAELVEDGDSPVKSDIDDERHSRNALCL